ncbi:MAG: phospholipase D-like domain-containing protein [Candidatus Bipolaricaulaceae bacterium]
MKALATVFLPLLGALEALAFPVLPIWSSPENPLYLQEIPVLLSKAEKEILAALSDVRAYAEGTTEPLLSALTAAAGRGVQVYLLMENSNGPFSPEQGAALARLRQAGVEVREDPPDITLHTKFLVIDGRWVVVGSTHWTKTALTASVQVDLAVEEPELASAFRQFFFHLWEGELHTKTRLPAGPWPEPALIPILDFPNNNGTFNALSSLLTQAQHEIALLLYQLAFYPEYAQSPSNLLLEALIEAAQRGLRVRVLLEGGERDPNLAETNRLSAAWLLTQGVEVRFDSQESTMHAKCLLVDGRHIVVTSANWNYSSLIKNAEAGVLLLGVPELSQYLNARFTSLWEGSRPWR